ncbi:hypothetical protein [Clostridium oryzae]|uniref:DUF4177 domain-containing protein n=1 Tax=Clostridium oryzae TaxID=1450648 RepID=A0A1V4IHU3_9CLOT|nr:hypothetical protein [Clostridium oryzae]OPJ59235.1 hypothetical protein CLORY_33910 [Clostridium oryzae]
MKKQEKAFIVRKYGQNENTEELNSLLSEGWSVTSISPMSGGGQSEAFALVILQKQE